MAIDANDPEVKALIEAAAEQATQALAKKNAELLAELKAAKAKAKGADIDPAEYAELQTKVEELTGALEKAQKAAKTETERLAKQLGERDAALSNVLIEGGIVEQATKAGIATHYLPAVKAMFRGQATLKAEGGQFVALLGDKPLAEAIATWAQSDEGAHYRAAAANSGGGAAGGRSGTAGRATMTRAAFEALHPAQKVELSKTGVTLTD